MSLLSEPVYFFLILGVAMILIEIAVLQLSTFWLLFIGIGALAASLLLYLAPGVGWVGGMGIFVVTTVITTLLLYRPLRAWQNAPSPIQGNDAIGQSVAVVERITADSPGKVTWSGTEWPAELKQGEEKVLEIGDRAEIVELTGITLIVS